MTAFRELGLSRQILSGVRDAGYTTPTPIQAAAIPVLIEGHDLTGCAQTGTGKTASFVLPMLERLLTKPSGTKRTPVRALVVVPTRELALQVENSVRTYGKGTGLRSVAVYGGVGMEPQYQAFRRGVDIVIATPGRLLDHLNRRSLDLSRVEMLILDEADRMFDMGFINDIKKIVAAIPEERQTVLFSATMPKEIQHLAESIQRDPKLVEIGKRRNPAETVEQHIFAVSQEKKVDLLLHLLRNEPVESVLVFTRTKFRADKIAKRLNTEKIRAVAIHSNRSQNQRQQGLAGFRSGKFQVMVATDIAARGIDVDGISHVINFDTPRSPEDYIHRIGRTGRAETTGDAMTFVAQDEMGALRSIEKMTGKRIARQTIDGLTGEFGGREEKPSRPSARSRGNGGSPNAGASKPVRRKGTGKDAVRSKGTERSGSGEEREWGAFSTNETSSKSSRRNGGQPSFSDGSTSDNRRKGKRSGSGKKGYRKTFGGKVG